MSLLKQDSRHLWLLNDCVQILLKQYSGMSNLGSREIHVKDLMAQVGYLLFFWSKIELELDRSLEKLRAEIGSFDQSKLRPQLTSQKLKLWVELNLSSMDVSADQKATVEQLNSELMEALRIRNAICHGMISATGDPRSGKAILRISCNGQHRDVTFAELDLLVMNADKARIEINRMANG